MLNLGAKKRKSQNRHNITYRENNAELELFEWINKKGEVGGVSNFIKSQLYEIMKKDREHCEE